MVIIYKQLSNEHIAQIRAFCRLKITVENSQLELFNSTQNNKFPSMLKI